MEPIGHGQRHRLRDVFTPSTRARLNFVPRASVNDHIVSALTTPGKQLVVYGETGSGKSTLLHKKLEELYPDHVVTRCTKHSTFESIVLDAFDKLNVHYVDTHETSTESRTTGRLGAEFARVRASVDVRMTEQSFATERRALPPQLTIQRLGEFMGARGLAWVIEDFHKVPIAEKAGISQALKVFSDLAADYPDLRVVAVGAADTAREVIDYDHEMRDRVAEVLVPLMTEEELAEIILGGQLLLNVDMSAVRTSLVRYSMGVAGVCHQLALNLCLNEGVLETAVQRLVLGPDHLQPALLRWVEESSDSLKAKFDRALRRHKVRRYDNTRLILQALAEGPLEGLLYAEVLRAIKAREADYPPGNLTLYLRQLMEEERGKLVLVGSDSRYRFVDPLHHTYAQAVLGRRRASYTLADLAATLGELARAWQRPKGH